MKRPYILIGVYGGIADVYIGDKRVEVDILDLDTVKDQNPGERFFSDREWEWLKAHEPEQYARLALAEFTPDEEKAWEHYFREGKARRYGDDRAGAFAWRQMQTDPDFARLQNYHGAKIGKWGLVILGGLIFFVPLAMLVDWLAGRP